MNLNCRVVPHPGVFSKRVRKRLETGELTFLKEQKSEGKSAEVIENKAWILFALCDKERKRRDTALEGCGFGRLKLEAAEK